MHRQNAPFDRLTGVERKYFHFVDTTDVAELLNMARGKYVAITFGVPNRAEMVCKGLDVAADMMWSVISTSRHFKHVSTRARKYCDPWMCDMHLS